MRARNLTEDIAVLTQIAPAAARNTGSYVGEAVDAKDLERLVAILNIGTLAGTGTAVLKFQHSSVSASSAAAWADVSSTSCITSAFGSGSNGKIAQLELRVDQYSALNRYVRPYVEVATSNGWVGNVVVLGETAFKPATGFDSADVVQTVVY